MQIKLVIAVIILVIGLGAGGYYLKSIAHKSTLSIVNQPTISINSPTITLTTTPAARTQQSFISCVPKNIDVSSPYAYEGTKVKMSIGQELQTLGAFCTATHVLVDRTNKKIDIEEPLGCWGNPPANYQELLTQEAQRIQNLKKIYTVIVSQCNPLTS